MAKRVDEMTAAGSGATIGPIQPIGASKESVEEMLQHHPDIRPWHMAVFARNAARALREDFRRASRVSDFEDMASIVREEVVRQAVRRELREVVRKKDGKYVLYAPNAGKKHRPKPVAIFSTKLAAKRAELAKFPPKDPEKLERLKSQIDKLLKDPDARAKEVMMKETVDRDLFETAIIGLILQRDITRTVLREDYNLEERRPKGDEYTSFVKRFSKRAMQNDPEFQEEQDNYKAAATKALSKKAVEISKELGLRLKPLGEPKRHRDGKIYMAAALAGENFGEVKPIFLVADGAKVKIRVGSGAMGALTKATQDQNLIHKVRSVLGTLNEDETPDDPDLAPAYGRMVDGVKGIHGFLDQFLTKLSPRAMTMLKQLLAKKHRKLGVGS